MRRKLRVMTTDALQLRAWVETPDDSPRGGLFPSLRDDDYAAGASHAGATRRRLEALLETEGHHVQLATRSPRVLRDLDLLRELDGRHAVSVGIAAPSVDSSTTRRLEGPGASPAERLRALAELSAAGLSTTLVWTPVLPGVNDDPRSVDRLFAAARRAGVRDVELQLPELSWLDRWRLFRREGVRDRDTRCVRRRFDLRGRLRKNDRQRLNALFARKRLAHGFPQTLPGRG